MAGWFDQLDAPTATGGATPRRRFGDMAGGGLDAPAPAPSPAPAPVDDPIMRPGGPGGQPAAGTQPFTEEQFRQIVGNGTLTSDQLWALRDELAKHGVEVMTNAEGIHGKISFMRPDGRREIVDVIGGASSGGDRLQWLSDNGVYGAGGGGTPGFAPGQLPPGYEMGMFTGGGQYPLASVNAPGLMAPWMTPFEAPNVTDDPGYKFRLDQGTQAIERAAAARGTHATGGTLKDLTNFAQGLASTEYGNAYNRKMGEYLNAYNIFDRNQANQYGRLRDIAGMGLNATSGFTNNATNLITGRGNAEAAGTIGARNAGPTAGDWVGLGTEAASWFT